MILFVGGKKFPHTHPIPSMLVSTSTRNHGRQNLYLHRPVCVPAWEGQRHRRWKCKSTMLCGTQSPALEEQLRELGKCPPDQERKQLDFFWKKKMFMHVLVVVPPTFKSKDSKQHSESRYSCLVSAKLCTLILCEPCSYQPVCMPWKGRAALRTQYTQ